MTRVVMIVLTLAFVGLLVYVADRPAPGGTTCYTCGVIDETRIGQTPKLPNGETK